MQAMANNGGKSGTRTIALVNERGIAVVSAEDYERVRGYRWYLHKGYAVT